MAARWCWTCVATPSGRRATYKGALHIYIGHLQDRLAEVPDNRPVAAICGTGRRASLAASILERAGRTKVANVLGSMSAWNAAGFPTVVD